MASYTLSKSHDRQPRLLRQRRRVNTTQSAYSSNAYDRHGYNYGPAFFDVRHNLVVSNTYDLPVGKGRTFGKDWHPVVNAIAGRLERQQHLPIAQRLSRSRSLSVRRVRCKRRVGPNVRTRLLRSTTNSSTPDCYIPNPNNRFCPSGSGTSSFGLPDLGTFGSAGVGTVYAPGFFNWDTSIGKKFYMTEHKYFDFRAEFFNFTNHPELRGAGS